MMYTLLAIIIFFLGASLASFLSAMISRKNIRSQFSSQKRSHCDTCKRVLHGYELIPIFGFLMNQGRCKNCHNNIPIWYVLAEVLGGIIALGTASLLLIP